VLGEAVSNNGVLNVFNAWKSRREDDNSRLRFYLDILDEQIRKIEQQLSFSLKEIPLIISGMASSAIGIMELPYKKIPLAIDEELIVQNLELTKTFPHPVLLISGIRSDDDVIRGEETQLLGCMEKENGNGLFIFPGTQSKHILVKSGIAVEFKTYMTGEFFELLSQKSILAGSVAEGGELNDAGNLNSFLSGVVEGQQSNLLNGSFKIRTNNLFTDRN
jgi:2-dehydro-3-deoxygalactonokinase